MANLGTAMDSSFWDLNISSPRTLVDASARAVPGESFPLDAARASVIHRTQQLMPRGILPAFSPTCSKELGSFALQSLLLKPSFNDWWLGLIGHFRPKRLVSYLIEELSSIDGWELPHFKDAAKIILDKSLYALGICSQLHPTPSSLVTLSTEAHGERKGLRTQAMFSHKFPYHDVTLQGAWPELFIDHRGEYWNVPESVSLDLLSHVSKSGLRYRFGLHKSCGQPEPCNGTTGEAPSSLMPGLCAKAAFSYEKIRDIWRRKQEEKDLMVETHRGSFLLPSYDLRLSEPHAAISAIIGGTCAAWLGGKDNSVDVKLRGDGGNFSKHPMKNSYLNADLFGSICYTYQHGNFNGALGDLTRFDTRLDICSVSLLAKRVGRAFGWRSNSTAKDSPALPRLTLTCQQQILGPIVFRVDSKFGLDSSSGRSRPCIEDMMYSLSFSLRSLGSGNAVAWYSPKRKEGMIELRIFEC